jgi:hypothetical protein
LLHYSVAFYRYRIHSIAECPFIVKFGVVVKKQQFLLSINIIVAFELVTNFARPLSVIARHSHRHT